MTYLGQIDPIMMSPVGSWIRGKIDTLPTRACFNASNSIRSLEWSNKILNAGLNIPANFFSLHATEEASVCLMYTLRELGYKDSEKINPLCHRDKATVSIMALGVFKFLQKFEPALAASNENPHLTIRITQNEETEYSVLSTECFNVFVNGKPSLKNDILSTLDGEKDLIDRILFIQNARNDILYAANDGYPVGFTDPIEAAKRDAYISLGLMWAAIDIFEIKDKKVPLAEEFIKLVIEYSAKAKNKRFK